jgi:hypothetical protein
MEENVVQELERLKHENERLKTEIQRIAPTISFKVSSKGAVSVYGLGRFPVTLYKEQWEKLLSKQEEIHKFIQENDSLLKKRD